MQHVSEPNPEARAALERVAPYGSCPFCKGNTWAEVGAGGLGYVNVVGEPGQFTVFDAFTLGCTTCGFIRQHATNFLGVKS
jgi:hypothetical protein